MCEQFMETTYDWCICTPIKPNGNKIDSKSFISKLMRDVKGEIIAGKRFNGDSEKPE